MYLRDTLRLPAKGLTPSALPIFHQPARRSSRGLLRGYLSRQMPSFVAHIAISLSRAIKCAEGPTDPSGLWLLGDTSLRRAQGRVPRALEREIRPSGLPGVRAFDSHLGQFRARTTFTPRSAITDALALLSTRALGCAQDGRCRLPLCGWVGLLPIDPVVLSRSALRLTPQGCAGAETLFRPSLWRPFDRGKGRNLYLRGTLRLPARALAPLHFPFSSAHQPAKAVRSGVGDRCCFTRRLCKDRLNANTTRRGCLLCPKRVRACAYQNPDAGDAR